MELVPSRLYIGESVNFKRAGFPMVPTVKSADIAFGGELVLSGPEPARATFEAWWPAWADSTRPKLRDSVWLVMAARGSSGITEDTANVFVGRVDGVTRRRRHAPASEVARRLAEPTRILRTARNYFDPTITLDHVSLEWWQAGEAIAYTSIRSGELWQMPRAIADLGDGIFDPAQHVEARIPIHPLDVPTGSPASPTTVHVSERYRIGGGRTGWRWYYDGALRGYLFSGPLVLTGPAPADLALVSAAVLTGEEIPDLRAPAIVVGDSRGLRPAGEWLTITASDIRSEAGRMKIGAPPFPAETPAARWDRVAAIANGLNVPVPRYSTLTAPWSLVGDSRLAADATAGQLAARDVDNQPIGALLAEAAAGVGAVPVARMAGIFPWRAKRHPRILTASGTVETHPETVSIPPGVVSEPRLDIRSTDLTNRVRITYVDAADGTTERTLTLSWPDSIDEWGEHASSWSTSQLASPSNPLTGAGIGPVADRLTNAIGGMSAPAYRFAEPIVLPPARLAAIPDGTKILDLLDLDTRHGMPLMIEHEIPDAPTTYSLAAGSLVIEDGRVILTLQPEPAGHAGAPGVVFGLMATSLPALTFAQIDQTLTFQETTAIGVPE